MLHGSSLLTPAKSGPFADPLALLVGECGPVNLRTRIPFTALTGAALPVMTTSGPALTAWRSRIERGLTSGSLTTGDALFALVRVNTAATNGTIIAASSGTYGFSLQINGSLFRMVGQSNSTVTTDSTTTLNDGQIYAVLAFATGATAASRFLFVDGVDDTNTGTSTGTSGLTTTHYGVTIGNTPNNVSSIPACDIIMAAAWRGRQFSASDAIAITRDQSLLFERRPLWVRTATTAGVTVGVPAGSLTLTGFAPTVSTTGLVSVPAGSLTLTGLAPTVAVSGGSATVAVPAGALTLTGFAPTVDAGYSASVSVPAGSLALTGFAPTVSNGSMAATVSVPVGALTLTGYAPTVYIRTLQLGPRLDEYPRLPLDPGQMVLKLTTLFAKTNLRVNELSQGLLWASWNATAVQPNSTSGAWGDTVRNSRPVEQGSPGSKYVVIGWIRLETDWSPMRVLTGN